MSDCVNIKNKDVFELIKSILEEVSSFRIEFNFDKVKIVVISNEKMFTKKEFLILIKYKGLVFPMIKNCNEKYSEYFKKDINLEHYKLKGVEYSEAQLKEYQKLFVFPLIDSNSLPGQKLDKFWVFLFFQIKKENALKTSEKYLKKIYTDNKESKNLGIYIETYINFKKNKMSKKMFDHLVNYFEVPNESIFNLKKRGKSIRTSWDKSKHNPIILQKLRDNSL